MWGSAYIKGRSTDTNESSYEQFPTKAYPSPNEDIILGLCFGELSATAVSLARNLLELLPIAVEAVRQAFRGGVLTYTTAKELEPQAGLDESWSLAVPRDSGLADGERIEQLCVQLVSPRHQQIQDARQEKSEPESSC